MRGAAIRYDVTAVRYGTFETTKSECYHRFPVYGEADTGVRMDYYFWVIRSGDDVTLVDSGFDAAAGARRGRTPLHDPGEALARLGLAPAQVSRVVATHFHYDHIGNLARFPDAEILASGREVDFWTGPLARREQFAQVVEEREIAYIETAGRQGRLTRLGDEEEIAPGLRTRCVGGHTPGQLVVTVPTRGRDVVLASDAVHLYEEVERDRPFAILTDVPRMYQAYDLLRDLTSDGNRVLVAGHDPLVMERFTAVDGLDGVAVRLA